MTSTRKQLLEELAAWLESKANGAKSLARSAWDHGYPSVSGRHKKKADRYQLAAEIVRDAAAKAN